MFYKVKIIEKEIFMLFRFSNQNGLNVVGYANLSTHTIISKQLE